jgi:type IV secretion system protein TrbL
MLAQEGEPCSGILCNIGGIGEAIGGAVNYWQDPFGNTFKALKDAAAGLARDVLPALTEATLPDLSADWFVNAYAIAFAVAILAAIVLLIPQFVRTARGTMAGRDLLESIGIYFPLFLVGAMFGPMFGYLLVNFFHALSNVFITWGVAGSYSEVITRMESLIDTTDPATLTGGVFIAVVLMLLMVLGLFLVVLMLIVQLVTLYFTGVLIPLGIVWIIDPTKRSFGLRLVQIWLGILAAHPLLFFLLGFAFNMMAGSIVTFGENEPLQTLVTFLVAILALFMAALSPLMLLKFAPVIPTGMGGTSGPSIGGSPIGSNNMTDAGSKYGQSADSGSNSSSTSTSTTATSDAEPSTVQSAGGLSDVAAARAADGAAGSKGAPGGETEAAAGARGAAGASAGGAAGAAAGTEGLAAAGAAESSTGVGAAIGVPTMIAAGAVAAAEKAREVGEAASNQAVAPMDDQGSTIGEERP